MFRKTLFTIASFFIIFSSSFATNYTISKSDYDKVQIVNHKLDDLINRKYSNKKYYYYQVIIDTIDGYVALHPNISTRKKVMLLCVKTYFIKKIGYKFDDKINIYIKK